EHGPEVARMIARSTEPAHEMLPVVLSRMAGVTERLEAGASVLDVGCGCGVAIHRLAREFPMSCFRGHDPSPEAIGRAWAESQRLGLTNVTYVQTGGEDLPKEPTFDLVMTLDCMHDLPRPEAVIRAIRGAIKPQGVWLIKDIRCWTHEA
ncbi:MAG: class I SAM-dependent methyltransferase, partial [Acidobacteriota bacterium]